MSRRPSSIYCVEALEDRRLLSAGTLDTSFSLDGMTTFTLQNGRVITARDVAVQADGKVVVVGNDNSNALYGANFVLARFNVDGSPDITFGPFGTGLVVTEAVNFGVATRGGACVAIDAGGNIYVAGGANDGKPNTAVVKYNPSGVEIGARVLDFGTFNGYSFANDIVIQNDGKLVVAGYFYNDAFFETASEDFALIRLNPNMSLDSTFDGDGRRGIDFGDAYDNAYGLAIDYSGTPGTNPAYGRIIVVGGTGPENHSTQRWAIARLTTGGALDSSFDSDGKLTTAFFADRTNAQARAVVVQPDGKYVIAGRVALGSNNNFAIYRINRNGSQDTPFGNNGRVELDLGGNDMATSIILGQTGKLMVGGFSGASMVVACLSSSSSLDTKFGAGGIFRTSFSGTNASAAGLALAPGGKLVAAGGNLFATVRIFDRAPTVSVYSSDNIVTESGPTTGTVTFYRDEILPVATRVPYTLGGTAWARQGRDDFSDYDYFGIAAGKGVQYVDIPAGQNSVTLTITARDDALVEPHETISVTIARAAGLRDAGFSQRADLLLRDNDHQIGGWVYNDVNANGGQDPGEVGLSGWTIYLDANNNTLFDAGERSATSDSAGFYAFAGLPAGNQIVREVVKAGYRRTWPIFTSYYEVTVGIGGAISNIDFANTTSVRVSGNVFLDADKDAVRDTGEGLFTLGGAIVYRDSNNNKLLDPGEPQTPVDSAGNYALDGLPPGTQYLRIKPPSGYAQSFPLTNGSLIFSVASAGSTTGRNFGIALQPVGSIVGSVIKGNVFNDLDLDGLRDVVNPVEPDLSGRGVFLDLNKNGVREAAEPHAGTDSSGNFAFSGLTAGTLYRVRHVLLAGWYRTNGSTPYNDVTAVQNGSVSVRFATAPIDPDDTISEVASRTANIKLPGQFADFALETAVDVDLIKFTVTAGQTIGFDVDSRNGSNLDTFLRVFTASGTQLASNDNGNAPGEVSSGFSYLSYRFATAGTYYVAVSKKLNNAYSIVTGAGDKWGTGSLGQYRLNLGVITTV